MVSKGDWLGGLQVSKAWHNGVGIFFRQFQHAPLQTLRFCNQNRDGIAQI